MYISQASTVVLTAGMFFVHFYVGPLFLFIDIKPLNSLNP